MFPLDNLPDIQTVESTWLCYDLAEQELWREYELNPNISTGKKYILGEFSARKSCEKTIQKIRYKNSSREVLV